MDLLMEHDLTLMSMLLLTSLLLKMAWESKKLLLKVIDAKADLDVLRLRRISCMKCSFCTIGSDSKISLLRQS